MKFRKILSAVTALAMSASVVAGLAVTASAETEYVNVDYEADDYQGYTSTNMLYNGASSVDLENITYSIGYREAGAFYDYAKIVTDSSGEGYELLVESYGSYSDSRAVALTFDSTPLVSELTEGEMIILSFKIKAGNAFTVNGYGTISTSALTTTSDYVCVYVILDPDTDKQYLVVKDTSGNQLSATSAALSATSLTGIQFDTKNVASSARAQYYLDDIVLKTGTIDLPTSYSYTVNYYLGSVADNNLVATDSTGWTDEGTVTISAGTAVWGTEDGCTDNKYYVSADATLTINTTDTTKNVLSVVVRAAETYNVVINATGDITQSAISSASIIEGEDDYVYYPRYIYDENAAIVYETSPEDKYAYRISYTDMADDDTVDLTYSKAYENVVYFADLDDSDDTGTYIPSYASNGLARNNEAWSSDTLQPGTYQIAVMACRRYRHSLIKVGDTTLFDIDASGLENNAGYWGLLTTTFTIDEAAAVELVKSDTAYDPIDTIIITQSPVLTAAVTESGDTDDSTVSAPTITGNVTEANGTAKFDYDTLVKSGGNVVKTIYVKVINPDDDTTPTITINGDVYTPVWQPVTGTSASYYFAQFIGAASGFGNTITIGYGELSESVELGE